VYTNATASTVPEVDELSYQWSDDGDTIFIKEKERVTDIDLGNVSLLVTRRYNWFQKQMMRFFFGWRVTDIGERR
jgi:hypothetical protein